MNEITIREDQEYELMKKQAGALFKSGFFTDLKSYEQAVAKVMMGKELGIGPFSSMANIHLIGKEGQTKKPSPSANLMATLIAKSPNYLYRIKKCDNKECIISFYESTDKKADEKSYLGDSTFTIEEAQEAGLLGKDIWKKYPSDMLFARALSRGARRFAAGIFGGVPMYTPDELGADIDEDGVIGLPHHVQPIDHSDEVILDKIRETTIISEEFR